ncbi:nucleotide exchange factor GrpE [Candidatus Woesearchaeota archaeon]|nr:nucleotide exchange factor GrpE [Candidatus Woesearchaeota archaeon]MBW3016935.1 nucleotide exchange factor GrpE [Candidatus Woesearchaeota archaeon]
MDKKKHDKGKDDDKVKELTDSLQRLQAEFENYKKRVDKEKQAFSKFACEGIVKELLPVLDSFDNALKEGDSQGIKQIHTQLMSILKAAGLKEVKAEGQFDPYLHEVLLKENNEAEEGTIIEVIQKGYMLNDKVIRHTKVKISNGGAENGNQ